MVGHRARGPNSPRTFALVGLVVNLIADLTLAGMLKYHWFGVMEACIIRTDQ
jgi:hypothetical protein